MANHDVQKYLENLEYKPKPILKKSNKTFSPAKSIIALLLVAGMCVLSTACQKTNEPDEFDFDFNTTQSSTSQNTYIATYNDEEYIFCKHAYAEKLCKQALKNVDKLMHQVEGMSPVGTKTGSFYPKYFNENMLLAIAYTESDLRIKYADGTPFKSEAGAIGMCQLTPIAIKTINTWLTETMELDKTYEVSDASDPLKALELAILYNIRNCKNKFKEGKNNYAKMGVEFSLELQEKLLYATYFYGEGNVQNQIDNGTIFDTYLNPDWRDSNNHNYVNEVLAHKAELLQDRYQ